ncbi:hypothetical protein DBR37_01720 [Herminiimonas sp. KBW02]|uniref:hypothetical protein n=1 Tax=Herminiimonas sp. KBW02 TaxID=2153363 RepID=UPI000F5ABD0B|nr:hypothetical protein [Herminiimonas sp. KBW02]RQO38637.1 hypothetical protein DBR37_01720 [Herminiimonas sp. KBW02]
MSGCTEIWTSPKNGVRVAAFTTKKQAETFAKALQTSVITAIHAHDDLVEYFNASESLQLTIGHENASADDEAKAEDRFQVARKAVRSALAKAGAA